MSQINPKLPVSMDITIDSAQEAITYWLQQVILKEKVELENVKFDPNNNLFRITLKRNEES